MKITRIVPPPVPQPEPEYQLNLSAREMKSLRSSLSGAMDIYDAQRVSLLEQVGAALDCK